MNHAGFVKLISSLLGILCLWNLWRHMFTLHAKKHPFHPFDQVGLSPLTNGWTVSIIHKIVTHKIVKSISGVFSQKNESSHSAIKYLTVCQL